MEAYIPDLYRLLPEGIIVALAILILLEGAFRKVADASIARRFGRHAALALFIACVILIIQHEPTEKWVTFEGQIYQDDFVYFAKLLIMLGSAAVMIMSLPSLTKENILIFEYPSLVLFATLGMLLMVEANDLMSLFIGLEMQGLSLYILAALNRNNLTGSEAALKYFVLGAVSTCLFLYGASLLYGFTGMTNFEGIAGVIRSESEAGLPLGFFIALIFIIASLSFKVSAVPFHMWTPDVYQGCPTAITAFIAAAPKIAGMIVLLRLMVLPFILLYGEWQSIISIISLASMILGAFAALRQRDLKRLLAYSAIGQMGYVLLGVAAGNDEGIQAVFVYLALYLVMIIGTFACLLSLRGTGQHGVQNIEDLSGISNLHPKIAFVLAAFMFSLAGIPPLAGFFAKLYVFKAAISAGLFGLAIVGVLTSVVASYYYLKIVKVMYFDKVPETPSISYGQTLVFSTEMAFILNACGIIVIFFFIYPNPLLEMAKRAALSIPL
jgi:NADH-quinone oxidoreductase subunit N